MRTVNKKAINTAAKVLANQVKTLVAQGYQDMYFTAQFYNGGKRQNGIERGNVTTISKQVRDYVKSEEADTMNVEMFEESTDKSVYRKKFSNLIEGSDSSGSNQQQSGFNGFGSHQGLGEVEFNALVDKRVEIKEQAKDFTRMAKELDECRSKYSTLESEKAELEAELTAKKNLEFYSGIIGAAFPGLAPLFNGTPLAQAAGYLAGAGDLQGNALPQAKNEDNSEGQSVGELANEFCNTLNAHDSSAIHLLLIAFEKDRNQIHRALQSITIHTPQTT
jgi:hypothetical protein